MAIKLIVGLGNPGDAYVNTRHNIGFKLINALVKASTIDASKKATLKSHVYSVAFGEQKMFAIKPQTYMNLSGEAVVSVMNFYKLKPSEICVVTDDLDVPFGKVRVRAKGGAGTHNGMKSVIQQLGTQEFMRLRLGIGPKPEFLDSKDFVLQNFTSSERDVLPGMITKISAQLIDNLSESVDVMMNRLNPLTYFENDINTGDSRGA